MSEPAWIWRSEHVIPSQPGAGCDAIHEVLEKLGNSNWDDSDIFSVQLAMEEAVVNAVKHGNRLDDRKMVRINSHLAKDLIRIEISDEGSGFDPESIPDPTEECHRDAPGGRGVMLMRNFMSSITFNAAGNQVLMEKRRGEPGRSSSCTE